MNSDSETFTPLVCSVVDDVLLKAMPAIPYWHSIHVVNFSEADPLLNFYANFIVHWVHIWMLEPQAWWNERECLPFQKSEVEDTGTEAVRTHWADTLFHWKIKNSQQILHMTGSCC